MDTVTVINPMKTSGLLDLSTDERMKVIKLLRSRRVDRAIDKSELSREIFGLNPKQQSQSKVLKAIQDKLNGFPPVAEERARLAQLFLQKPDAMHNIRLLFYPPPPPSPIRFYYGGCGVLLIAGLGVIIYGFFNLVKEYYRNNKIISFNMQIYGVGIILILLGAGIVYGAFKGYKYFLKQEKKRLESEYELPRNLPGTKFAAQTPRTKIISQVYASDNVRIEPDLTVFIKFFTGFLCILLSIRTLQLSYENVLYNMTNSETLIQVLQNNFMMILGILGLFIGFNFLPYPLRNIDLFDVSTVLPDSLPEQQYLFPRPPASIPSAPSAPVQKPTSQVIRNNNIKA
jgi:hypothetical protein